jgi:hypothetical protein
VTGTNPSTKKYRTLWEELVEKYKYNELTEYSKVTIIDSINYDELEINKASKFSLLIAGPINKTSLDHITKSYDRIFDDIIISCWSDFPDDAQETLQSFLKTNKSKARVCMKPTPDPSVIKNSLFKHYKTLFPQVCGILNAANQCSTEYLIRSRSDEFFTDLSPMMNLFLKNTDGVLWVGHSLGDRRRVPYSGLCKSLNNRGRVGDHLFVAKTSLIRDVYKSFFELSLVDGAGLEGERRCEETLRRLFERCSNIDASAKEKMFSVMSVEELGAFKFSTMGNHYTNEVAKERGLIDAQGTFHDPCSKK